MHVAYQAARATYATGRVCVMTANATVVAGKHASLLTYSALVPGDNYRHAVIQQSKESHSINQKQYVLHAVKVTKYACSKADCV
jgi:hypothetical protein